MKFKITLVVTAILFSFLTSCELSPIGGAENEVAPSALRKNPPNNNPKNPKNPGANCNVYVTATQFMCAYGAWGDIWLRLDNGYYLQPWDNSTSTTQIIPGARYKIGYTLMAKDSRYDGMIFCMVVPSDPMAWTPSIVSVTCLEPVIN